MIHAMTDALGNPLAFLLTGGQAHDLEGSDAFLPAMRADMLLADRAFDADLRLSLATWPLLEIGLDWSPAGGGMRLGRF